MDVPRLIMLFPTSLPCRIEVFTRCLLVITFVCFLLSSPMIVRPRKRSAGDGHCIFSYIRRLVSFPLQDAKIQQHSVFCGDALKESHKTEGKKNYTSSQEKIILGVNHFHVLFNLVETIDSASDA